MLKHYRAFKEWLAVKLASAFSTMEAFFLFLVLVMVPFAWPQTLALVQFLSSGLIQLVALPLIGVSNVIVSRASDAARDKDHRALMYQVRALKRIAAQQHLLIVALHADAGLEVPEPPDEDASEFGA